MKCYAAWNPSQQDRKGSASGGVATLLARSVLRSGGVYFGTRWNNDMQAVVAWTETDPEPFRGSRYVQPSFGAEARTALEGFLAAGRTVLFVGIPCQVASLQKLKQEYGDRLLCVDLLCHGTTEAAFLAEEVRFLSKGARVSDIRFREGARFRMSVLGEEKCLWARDARWSPYLYGYLSGITLREACFRCPFACPERTGDLTLGDFIGLPGGVSFAWPHTPEGERLLGECGAVMEEHPTEERFSYRPGILEASARPSEASGFRARIAAGQPFHKAIRRTLLPYFLLLPFRLGWKWLHHKAHLLRRRLSF